MFTLVLCNRMPNEHELLHIDDTLHLVLENKNICTIEVRQKDYARFDSLYESTVSKTLKLSYCIEYV